EGCDSEGSCKPTEKEQSMSSNWKVTGEREADLCFLAFKEFDLSIVSAIWIR
ncbi:hypothetical protein HispidOSU_005796, partial [Sigmodon hispidus]